MQIHLKHFESIIETGTSSPSFVHECILPEDIKKNRRLTIIQYFLLDK